MHVIKTLTWDLLRLMVYGFLQFCRWFNAVYPDYFVSPLPINGSSIESIFSALKFAAGGNVSASNYGSFRGRVIGGREVIDYRNSERGYRDDVILVSGSLTSTISNSGSRSSYSVRLVYDPFGINGLRQFSLSGNLSQSTIGGRRGSNACTLVASLLGFQFVKHGLPELTASTLPSQWFEVLVWAMFEGNALHDLLFDGEARNLDIEDAVESCGDDLHISSYEQAIGFDLRSGDFSPLVTTLQERVSRQPKQFAILTCSLRTVAVLIWETEATAIVDSHSNGQRGAMVGYVPHGQSSCSDIVKWYSGVMQNFINENLGLCTLTFVSYDCT
ncbi:uncharacterized protein [Montipora foliosa]|uniref:uncharacterized protein n=1 Tax=Montipora foliosa TaxID=591990 RepID=UPI0035F21686